jgi:putative ubiquitin-RnfH superfamily antitoxin RatB of RatAB toxin-antitoxin module
MPSSNGPTMSTVPDGVALVPLSVTLSVDRGPGDVAEQALLLPAGACVRDALVAAGMTAPETAEGPDVGIWGRASSLDMPLQPGDRIELYRPLRVDPKIARRERFRSQGARATGLFAKQREGGKSGY